MALIIVFGILDSKPLFLITKKLKVMIGINVRIIMLKKSLINEVVNSNELQCFVTDLPRKFEKLGKIFLGETINQPQLVNDF